MKIGVLTHSTSDDNYGQVLQCYALQQYLLKCGHQPFLIQYDEGKAQPQIRDSAIRSLLRFILGCLSPNRRKAYKEIKVFKGQRAINAVQNKQRHFSQFKRENLILSRSFVSLKELHNDPPVADAYIVGSDQVWNPPLDRDSSLAWYLQFGATGTKRIAYAASFGRELNAHEYHKFRALLDGFDAISVRESSALECCRKAGVNNATIVLDPTLLVTLDVYKPFFKDTRRESPYLFLYYLNVINKESLAWDQIESFIMAKNLDIITVSSSGYYPAFDLIPDHANMLLTIPDWLDAVYHSTYMVTTSFHGVAFAIIMHRPFVAILLEGVYSGGNGRIIDLLKSLGLSDRILTRDNSVGDILETPIDWMVVDRLLEGQRKSSETFLQEALSLDKDSKRIC